MIYLLTGSIRSGKTTALLRWAAGRPDTDGVLCPDNEKGKRYFLELRTRKRFPVEAGETHTPQECMSVGRFRFLKNAFTQANRYLIGAAQKQEYTYLIIDELGKLELKNTGLHEAAKELIPRHASVAAPHLILVVREYLVEEMLEHYEITCFRLLRVEDMGELGCI